MCADKIIIDTDPGIDDAMAIHLAFADRRLELIGLSSIFGNVFTHQATRAMPSALLKRLAALSR